MELKVSLMHAEMYEPKHILGCGRIYSRPKVSTGSGRTMQIHWILRISVMKHGTNGITRQWFPTFSLSVFGYSCRALES
jgi:hypothetical protein